MWIVNAKDQTLKHFKCEDCLSDFFNSLTKEEYDHYYWAKTKKQLQKLLMALTIVKGGKHD